MLLLAQLLAVVAAERKKIVTSLTVPIKSAAGREQVRAAVASQLQQLTDKSCCTPVLLADPTTWAQGDTLQPLPIPSKRVSMLRGAVLISKLASLTFNVKADLLGHADPDMPMSVQSLWHIMSHLADNVRKSDEDGKLTWSAQEQTLCVVLHEHSAATLRPAVKEPQAGVQKEACLRLLFSMLHMAWCCMHPPLLKQEIQRLGKESTPKCLRLRVRSHLFILCRVVFACVCCAWMSALCH